MDAHGAQGWQVLQSVVLSGQPRALYPKRAVNHAMSSLTDCRAAQESAGDILGCVLV